MTTISDWIIHFGSIGAVVSLAGLGTGLGQGIACKASFDAMTRQPGSKQEIFRSAIISMALIETASIIGFLTGILLYNTQIMGAYGYLGSLGVALAVAIPAFTVGIFAAFPAQNAFYAISRQPFFNRNITNLLILTQSIMQTPLIFAFIIAVSIRNELANINTLAQGLKFIACGLCIGLGAIGPVIGLSIFSSKATSVTGINRKAYSKILSFSFFSQAMIETPILFAFMAALSIYRLPTESINSIAPAIALLGAAFTVGLGTLGTAISSGRTSAEAIAGIANNPESYDKLSKLSLLSQAIIDTTAIYTTLIAFNLISKAFI